MFSILFILLGLYTYYANFGWTFPPAITPGFFFSAILVLMGLIMFLQSKKIKV